MRKRKDGEHGTGKDTLAVGMAASMAIAAFIFVWVVTHHA